MSAEPFYTTAPKSGERGRLLLISFHFPPASSPGALRWQKLAQLGAERGWGLDVITRHPSQLPNSDDRRLAELPDGISLYGIEQPLIALDRWGRRLARMRRGKRQAPPGPATPVPIEAKGLMRPSSIGQHELRPAWSSLSALKRAYHAKLEYSRDHQWAKCSVDIGRRILSNQHKAIISCGPPHMVHEGARLLASQAGLPFIMDLRDPWSLQPRLPESFASPSWYAMARRFESRTMEEAALIVTNTEAHAEGLRKLYPALKGRIMAVMNGYDLEPVPPPAHGGTFLIMYAGTVYLDRDPRPLFRATANMIRELGLTPQQIGIEFMGHAQSYCGMSLESMAGQEGIAEYVKILPPRPRQEALAFLARASVLVSLPQDSVMSIPSKIFEYMQFPAWLLALAEPESATEGMFREMGADVVAPEAVTDLTGVLRRRYEQFVRGDLPAPMTRFNQFSRASQAAKLFDAIDKLIDTVGTHGPLRSAIA